jgi:hypothetical protein
MRSADSTQASAVVKAEDEVAGLDVAEMGMEAYPDAVEIEAKVEKETGLSSSAARVHAPVAVPQP